MSLTEVQCYLDLGLYEEAWHAIDDLPPEERSTSEALSMRLRILDVTERWENCQYLAEGMVRDFPEWPLPRLLGAKALDKQGQVDAALAFLTASEAALQDVPAFWYQLGSYRARLGDVLGAKAGDCKALCSCAGMACEGAGGSGI